MYPDVFLWDVKSGELKGVYPKALASGLAFSPHGFTLATASSGKKVPLYFVGTGQQRAVLEGHKRDPKAVLFGPSGTTLASCDGFAVKVWDVNMGKELVELDFAPDYVASYSYAGDDDVIWYAISNGEVKQWHLREKKETTILNLKQLIERRSWWSQDGQTLVAWMGEAIEVWRLPAAKSKER
jgi:WD40 repeat protein